MYLHFALGHLCLCHALCVFGAKQQLFIIIVIMPHHARAWAGLAPPPCALSLIPITPLVLILTHHTHTTYTHITTGRSKREPLLV